MLIVILLCTGKSLAELRKIYFSLLNRIFCDALDPTESIEEFLKQALGEKTRVEQLHPPPYFMCTTTRVDVEPGQVKLVRYVETPLVIVQSSCTDIQ